MVGTREAEPIAIIGIGCRFPGGADSPDAYWSLLARGASAITELPRDRFDLAAFFDANPEAPGKIYSKWGGLVDRLDELDADFFGIAPREARH
jgi:acyl transferase domain-containing protein